MKQETELDLTFDSIIAELATWYQQGNDAQRELLIISIRDMSDIINEDMPTIID